MNQFIFVTCTEADEHRIRNMRKWERKGLLEGATILPHVEDPNADDVESVKDKLRKDIEACAFVAVISGEQPFSETWLKAIIELSEEYNKKLVSVRQLQVSVPRQSTLEPFEEIVFNPNGFVKQLRLLKVLH